MIGVMTRSKSCSGKCRNFSTARHPKTRAFEKAEGGAGGGVAVSLNGSASVIAHPP